MVYTYSTVRGGLVEIGGSGEELREFDERKPASIGQLDFKYEDPAIDVTTEQRTVEHDTIDDTIVVQSIGRKADQITINAIVADWELVFIDELTNLGEVTLKTDRWIGDVIVKSTDTTFRREKDQSGAWLYDATITCLESEEI